MDRVRVRDRIRARARPRPRFGLGLGLALGLGLLGLAAGLLVERRARLEEREHVGGHLLELEATERG